MKTEIKKLTTALALAGSCIAAHGAEPLDSTVRALLTPPVITEFAGGIAINAGLTELLKATIHEERPDKSDNCSFPSRHASWAFTASTLVSNHFYQSYPWIPVICQSGATAISLQRLHGTHHYGGDVAAGMLTGVLSAEASRALTGLLFGRRPYPEGGQSEYATMLTTTSEVLLPLSSRYCSGFAGKLRVQVPMSTHFGVAASAGAFAICRHLDYALEGLSMMVGGNGYYAVSRSWAAVADAAIGAAYIRRFDTNWGFRYDFHAGAQWFLTDDFAVSLTAGYEYYGALNVHCLCVGISSGIQF